MRGPRHDVVVRPLNELAQSMCRALSQVERLSDLDLVELLEDLKRMAELLRMASPLKRPGRGDREVGLVSRQVRNIQLRLARLRRHYRLRRRLVGDDEAWRELLVELALLESRLDYQARRHRYLAPICRLYREARARVKGSCDLDVLVELFTSMVCYME